MECLLSSAQSLGTAKTRSLLHHIHRRRLSPPPERFHDNLHILIQCHQEAQPAFGGELAEVAWQHLRDIGLANTEQVSRFHPIAVQFETRFVSGLRFRDAAYASGSQTASAAGCPLGEQPLKRDRFQRLRHA
jgi:hypothetical protein